MVQMPWLSGMWLVIQMLFFSPEKSVECNGDFNGPVLSMWQCLSIASPPRSVVKAICNRKVPQIM